MSGAVTWWVGLLTALVLVAPMTASALVAPPAELEPAHAGPAAPTPQSGPLAPVPVWSSTLPGPAGTGDPIFYDDYGWCERTTCTILDSDYYLAEKTNARFSTTGGDAWLVKPHDDSSGNGELQYLASSDAHYQFRVVVEPEPGILNTGQHLAVSYIARGPADAVGPDGGLRLQMQFWNGSDPVDCHMVPSVQIVGDYWRHVALNPVCNLIPATTELNLIFTVESGLVSSPAPGDVAIESILVERL